MTTQDPPQQIDENTPFADVFRAMDGEEGPSNHQLILAVGYARYYTPGDLLRDEGWRETLKTSGATQQDISDLERGLQRLNLLPIFTPEQASTLLGLDDQAERIAHGVRKAIAKLPVGGDDALRLFLKAAGKQGDTALIARIEATEVWRLMKALGAESLLDDIPQKPSLQDIPFSDRARRTLEALGIISLEDIRSRNLTMRDLYRVDGCGRGTVKEIVQELQKVGITIINE